MSKQHNMTADDGLTGQSAWERMDPESREKYLEM